MTGTAATPAAHSRAYSPAERPDLDGKLSEVLTEHYRQAHPEVLAIPLLADRRDPYHAPCATGVCPGRDDLAAGLSRTVPAVTERGRSMPTARA